MAAGRRHWLPVLRLFPLASAAGALLALLALFGAAASGPPEGAEIAATNLELEVFRGGSWHPVRIHILVRVSAGSRESTISAAEQAIMDRYPVAVRQTLSNENSSYVLSGYAWPGGTASWAYNPSGGPVGVPDQEAAITAGAAAWGATGAGFSFTYLGQTAAGTGACGGNQTGLDGQNTVGWAALPGGALGVTCSWFDGQVALEFDMELDPEWDWTTSDTAVVMDLQSVATHEFGHALGLDHPPSDGDPTAVMWATYTQGTLKRVPQCDDILGEVAIYGGTPPPECTQTPTPTPTPTSVGTPDATVSLTPTATPTPPGESGAVAASRLKLRPGANLFTWPGASSRPEKIYGDTEGLEAIYWWDPVAGKWRRWLRNGPSGANTLLMLVRGNAYWFLVTDPTDEGSPTPVPGT